MMLAKLVILLIAVVCGFLNSVPVYGAFKFSRNGKMQLIPNINERNFTDIPPACHLKINQSTLSILTRHREKNAAIELSVWMESLNNTLNKTRLPPEIIWANKMGRTLVSLIARAENIQGMILSSYTRTLTAGVDGVDVVISKSPEGCLLLENDVFYFLLHQLHTFDEDNEDFQLCSRKLKNETQYSCCGIHGQSSVVMCSEFSSFLTKLPTGLFMAGAILFIYISIPLLMDNLNHPPTESEYYKISDNPMSLSSIVRIIFIQGHGPLKSVGRKLVATTAVLVTGLPAIWDRPDVGSGAVYFFVCPWALIYLFWDFPFFTEKTLRYNVPDDDRFMYLAIHGSPTTIITLPFNLKFIWNVVNRFQKSIPKSTPNTEITEHTASLSQRGESQTSPAQYGGRLEVFKYRFSIVSLLILYFGIVFPILCTVVLGSLLTERYLVGPLLNNKIYKKLKTSVAKAQYGMKAFTLFILINSFVKCLVFTFFFSAGLYLNGKFYSVYFVPFSVVLFYSWSNWRSSIEAKYVELIVKIYEVCKESVPLQMTENTGTDDIPGTSTSTLTERFKIQLDDNVNKNNTDDIPGTSTSTLTERFKIQLDDNVNKNNTDDIPGTSTSTVNERFKIQLDDNGEPIIPKQLYDTIRERFLPYDETLFHYFEGVFFIISFSFFLYIMMSLAQTSELSGVVQIISTMAATSLPFIFDVVWKKCSVEQKAANTLSLKSKLKKVLVVHSYDTVTGEYLVEANGDPLHFSTTDDITMAIFRKRVARHVFLWWLSFALAAPLMMWIVIALGI